MSTPLERSLVLWLQNMTTWREFGLSDLTPEQLSLFLVELERTAEVARELARRRPRPPH